MTQAPTVNRSKGQYRVFFSDGYGLYLTFANSAYLGAAPMLFPNPVATIDDDTDSSGNEDNRDDYFDGVLSAADEGGWAKTKHDPASPWRRLGLVARGSKQTNAR